MSFAVLLATQRSGTHPLRTTLGTHRRIDALSGEVFYPYAELATYYEEAQACVLVSVYEGLPIALLEAME